MIQKTIKNVINEIYSKASKENYPTNKTDVYHKDEIYRFYVLDRKRYGPGNNRGYRYVLVITDNFSKFGWTVHLKNKNAQTIRDTFENILISSKRKPDLIQTDQTKKFYNSIFQNFLNNNNIQPYSRNTSLGAVFAERFNRTIRDLLEKPVFEKRHGNWMEILPTKTKHYNNRIHSTTKLTPIQASLKKIERFVYKSLLDNRNKIKPNFQ